MLHWSRLTQFNSKIWEDEIVSWYLNCVSEESQSIFFGMQNYPVPKQGKIYNKKWPHKQRRKDNPERSENESKLTEKWNTW